MTTFSPRCSPSQRAIMRPIRLSRLRGVNGIICKEFRLLAAGNGGDKIGRLHGLRLRGLAADELGDVPGVGFVVERFGIAHVERAVDFRFDAEDQFRIARVLAQVGRHCGWSSKRVRKEIAIGIDQRIVGIEYIQVDGPVVRIDGRFHRIADVVHFADVFEVNEARVGMGMRRHVSIDNPDQAAVGGEHKIGIVIPQDEIGKLSEAVRNLAMDHHAAFRREIAGEQNIPVAMRDSGSSPQPQTTKSGTRLCRRSGCPRCARRQDNRIRAARCERKPGHAPSRCNRDRDASASGSGAVITGGASLINSTGRPLAVMRLASADHDAVAVRVNKMRIDPTRACVAKLTQVELARR